MVGKGKINIKDFIFEIGATILGSFIMGVGISLFLLPNQLSSGGVTGIATILFYLLKIPMGVTILLINIPLLLMSIFKVGKGFFFKTVVGTVSLSVFIELLDKFEAFTTDRFLACIYGGIIVGIGTAILLKVNSSTGGIDLISYIAKEYRETIKLGNIITIMDTIIVLLNVILLKEVEIGLYSAIAIYLMGVIIDIMFEGIYFTKLVMIISDKNEEIAKKISEVIKRGTTGLYGKGMYTDKEKIILLCAASRRDISKIKIIARTIDKNAFLIITNSREVVGLGFKEKL